MPSLDASSRVIRSPELIVAEFDEGLVVLSVRASRYFGFNSTASAILRRMEQPISLGALSESLAEEFDIAPGDALDAVKTLVYRLVRLGVASTAGRDG